MKIWVFESKFLYIFCVSGLFMAGTVAAQEKSRISEIVNSLRRGDDESVSKAKSWISKMDPMEREELIDALINAFKEDDERASGNIIDAFVRIGPKAVPALANS